MEELQLVEDLIDMVACGQQFWKFVVFEMNLRCVSNFAVFIRWEL